MPVFFFPFPNVVHVFISICIDKCIFTGSSVRDDCLYSTSTQKQSFDSMTISQCQSKVSFDYDMNNQYGDLNKITKLPKQKLLRGGSTKAAHHPITRHAFVDSDINLTDKTYEIQYSINCTDPAKSKKSDSKLMRFIQCISRWRLQSRHLGYYSPRGTNPSIDTINVRLNPAIVAVTNNDIQHICESNMTQFGRGNRYGDSNGNDGGEGDGGNDDDGGGGGGGGGYNNNDSNDNHSTISISSVKENSEFAIKDELTAYMDELRLRELR